MSTTASRSVSIGFTSATVGVEYFQQFNAANFSPSIADIRSVDLVAGNNTVLIPVGAIGLTIIPPPTNTFALVLKGVTGDTGITLHPTDPTSLGIVGQTSIVINAEDDVTIRIIIS